MEGDGSVLNKVEEEHIDLPPGFRFHPTDEELITHYLSRKVLDSGFTAKAIGEVDLNKCEPWDLPWRAKMGEKEWYFFCVRDRKYPTGLRTNRATEAGYWKATGKDKEIYRGKNSSATLVGMKKTLVFYKGRAPKGEKSNWVMHEYRLEGKFSLYNLPKVSKDEWVICRVFQKSSGGKKIVVTGFMRVNSFGDELNSPLPPLTDSPYKTKPCSDQVQHVTCFSNRAENHRNTHPEEGSVMNEYFPSSLFTNNSVDTTNPTSSLYTRTPFQSPFYAPGAQGFHGPRLDSCDQAILRALLDSHGSDLKPLRLNQGLQKPDYGASSHQPAMVSISQETGLSSEINAEISSVVSNHEMGSRPFHDPEDHPSSNGPVDLDCLWNY
ncbi:hypothetical protein AMTRI_Chr04g190620 [Amborella trichopoda]|uniref:NAC domain-containing protein n=1 Tax=Amborella trichopoda TaxID=13333 RepID=W1NFF0_AMBTC|nr:NAC domain-containing protein 100 [Amborella trichopoda]ERM94547.1 hypothetical protein AMTR_s00010p00266320 [Amborella trichopoda]|eukprot:XP_006827310.1 NAC domain-containing protein 100 [Amborella trichopoda]